MRAIEIIYQQYTMQTRWFRAALEGISEEEGLHRSAGNGNHLRWLAGHLLISRFALAKNLGFQEAELPFTDLYTIRNMPPPNAKALDPEFDYPTLADIRERWERYTVYILEHLGNMTEERANAEMPLKLPIGGGTVLHLFAFVASHEAYHIGQMSMLRKELGHKPMTLA